MLEATAATAAAPTESPFTRSVAAAAKAEAERVAAVSLEAERLKEERLEAERLSNNEKILFTLLQQLNTPFRLTRSTQKNLHLLLKHHLNIRNYINYLIVKLMIKKK